MDSTRGVRTPSFWPRFSRLSALQAFQAAIRDHQALGPICSHTLGVMSTGTSTGKPAEDSSGSPDRSGKSWQEYVNRLLATHFAQQGHQYIPIPDKVAGDGGLEGFSTTGDGFQCYADEGSVNTADRAKKQKRKITTDLNKLAAPARQQYWISLLQGTKLSRWHLVVPVVEDKAVLVHAREKGAELQRMGLSFLSHDFQATAIAANQAFPVASKTLTQSGLSFIPDGYAPACEADLTAFASAQGEQIARLDAKLSKLPHMRQETTRKAAATQLLQRFLDSENLLARLRAANPTLWEQILIQRQEHARNLETDRIFDVSPPQERVNAAKERFRAAINALSQSTVSTASDTIAIGSIGLWLLECPLDFPEVTNV
jgi:hypothetical protein